MYRTIYKVTTNKGEQMVPADSPWLAGQEAEGDPLDVRLELVNGHKPVTLEKFDDAVQEEGTDEANLSYTADEVPGAAQVLFDKLTAGDVSALDNDGTEFTLTPAGLLAQKFAIVRVFDTEEREFAEEVNYDSPLTDPTYVATLGEFVRATKRVGTLALENLLNRGIYMS